MDSCGHHDQHPKMQEIQVVESPQRTSATYVLVAMGHLQEVTKGKLLGKK